MSDTVNLDRYFARIGYTGPRTATLDVLRAIHRLHPAAIPFENLNPLTRRPVRLDLESLQRKLVSEQRGGYCFEHNTLFANVLMQLGFKITPMLGRVLWGRERGAITPRTHMVLRIDIDGDAWIADVGFGSVTLTAPLRLIPALAQPLPLGTFRLAEAGHDMLYLEVQVPGESWAPVYRIDLRPVEWIDYETSNWYTSASPDSMFTHSLIVCRVFPGVCVTLFNDQLNERDGAGQLVAERRIESAAELADCLRERFGLKLDGIDIADVFERVRTRDETA
ncbi:arylamine N-acetyltransferase family protein [Paraburkholderia sp. ZP32-5]|uniref:arylamine N-acetyltransferase family protein n=1 Tax=Paraburkholderia sp. ZP32-5 TaxID=2883245 RepID=UPI001F3177DD|nr:arylamine N-acetyltransferase [Paraburkholderia sp. ZP32-5]